MNEVFTVHLALPLAVKGAVLPTPEGDYRIVINSAYNAETQREIFNHEMRHILLGHLHSTGALRLAERKANTKTLLVRQIRSCARAGLPPRPLFPLVHAASSGQAPSAAPTRGLGIRPLPPQNVRAPLQLRLCRAMLTNMFY